MTNNVIAIFFIFCVVSSCDDKGDSRQVKIEVRNESGMAVELRSGTFLASIAPHDTYAESFTVKADEPARESLRFDSLTITFDDGKTLRYYIDESVIVNNKERNPLSSESYVTEKVNGIDTFIYRITEEDYQRAN